MRAADDGNDDSGTHQNLEDATARRGVGQPPEDPKVHSSAGHCAEIQNVCATQYDAADHDEFDIPDHGASMNGSEPADVDRSVITGQRV